MCRKWSNSCLDPTYLRARGGVGVTTCLSRSTPQGCQETFKLDLSMKVMPVKCFQQRQFVQTFVFSHKNKSRLQRQRNNQRLTNSLLKQYTVHTKDYHWRSNGDVLFGQQAGLSAFVETNYILRHLKCFIFCNVTLTKNWHGSPVKTLYSAGFWKVSQ